MNDMCELHEDQKLESIFGCSWPPSAKDLAEDGKVWKVVKEERAPDKIAIGSTITFSNCCSKESGEETIRPTVGFANGTCSSDLEALEQATNVWDNVDLKYCTQYNALTGKVNITNDEGVTHPHTVTIRFSRANALSSNRPVIVCDFDDDVWNHSGSWRAEV